MAGRGRQLEKVETPFPAVHLVLFEKSPYWWIRFWDKEKRQSFFRSTETVDQQKAMALLPEVYQTYLLNPDALRREPVATVPELIDRFVAHHEGRVRRKEITERTWDAKKSSLKNGMIAYIIEFGLLRVRELNFKKDFIKYFEWRRAQGYKHSSIKLEIKIIKEFANWLQKNGFIKDATCNLPIPRMTHEAKDEEENEKAFNEEQIVLIRTELHKQIADSEGAEVYKWKQVLQYFELMLEGGFRTDELFHVEWRDIQMKANGECLMDVRISKTGRRNSVFISKTIPLIKVFQENKKVPVKKDTSLWTNPGTQKRWSKQFFTRRFRLVLGAVGLGKEFRLYCCRATHITRGIQKGVSTYLLAKNLGTSEGMIHRHYEDVIIEEQTRMLLQNEQEVLGFSWKERKASEQEFSPLV